ncbi:hypothetical protein NDU88_002647 [Pleurodeles waltl]|uniref:Uncharacterized protein n=1 Tax=Pleurodeles waltl TaxID=8319 RepID=A0AAV7Q7R3_PLEWA|nr:hypothetical protein NDU88_002647 [Pleurodeles waltl]
MLGDPLSKPQVKPDLGEDDPPVEGPSNALIPLALWEDFAALRKEVAFDVKAIWKELVEMGQRVDSLECAGDMREEKLPERSKELLELRDKNEDLLL